MDKRSSIVAEARRWLGTPYRHQQAMAGVGCDCAGLIRGVGVACGVLSITPARWSTFSNYARLPNPKQMQRGLNAFLARITDEDALPGDVLWLQWRPDLPMHLAILGLHHGRRTIIHSTSEIGRVVEHGLTAEWRARINSAWRYPGLVDGGLPNGP